MRVLYFILNKDRPTLNDLYRKTLKMLLFFKIPADVSRAILLRILIVKSKKGEGKLREIRSKHSQRQEKRSSLIQTLGNITVAAILYRR